MRKILVAIVDFNDIVPFVSLPDFGQPNVNSAAEGQPEEIGEYYICSYSSVFRILILRVPSVNRIFPLRCY